ncbi:hypothetical protein [Lysobacter claricitrinus]|uniref:hypothetical protein n=1 Tax=Lysobacter claricitrinus TaxID=3367728 RepID=UPI0037DB5FEB
MDAAPLEISTRDDGIAVLAVHGSGTVAATRRAVRAALIDVQHAGHRRVVIDVRAATGLGNPGVIERMDTVREWAQIAVPGLSLAFVALADFLDEDRIGMIVANRLGLNAQVFCCREEAVDWLTRQKAFRVADVDDALALQRD